MLRVCLHPPPSQKCLKCPDDFSRTVTRHDPGRGRHITGLRSSTQPPLPSLLLRLSPRSLPILRPNGFRSLGQDIVLLGPIYLESENRRTDCEFAEGGGSR